MTSKRGEDEKVGVPVVAYPAETGLGSNRISYISKQNVADVSCHHLTISSRSQRRDTEMRRNGEAGQKGETRKNAETVTDAPFRRFFNACENYNIRLSRIPFKTKGTRDEQSVTLSLCRAAMLLSQTAKKRIIVGVPARKC